MEGRLWVVNRLGGLLPEFQLCSVLVSFMVSLALGAKVSASFSSHLVAYITTF